MAITTSFIFGIQSRPDHFLLRRGFNHAVHIQQEYSHDVFASGDLVETVLDGSNILVEHGDLQAGGESPAQLLGGLNFHGGQFLAIRKDLVDGEKAEYYDNGNYNEKRDFEVQTLSYFNFRIIIHGFLVPVILKYVRMSQSQAGYKPAFFPAEFLRIRRFAGKDENLHIKATLNYRFRNSILDKT